MFIKTSRHLNIKKLSIAIAASLLTSGVIIGLRFQGILEQGELLAYDYLVRLNAQDGSDPRILLVEIDDSSLKKLNSDKVSDGTLAKTIKTLQQYQPRVIGIDILRDIPIGEGRDELITYINNLYEPLEGQIKPVIFSCALPSDSKPTGINPPPIIDVDSAVGFVDVEPDAINMFGGEIIRRALLSSIPASTSESSSGALPGLEDVGNPLCYSPFSLGFLTALSYLQAEDIFINTEKITEGVIKVGSATFQDFESNAGGYQNLETGVYQVILDYHFRQPAATIPLKKVLDGEISAEQIKDKVVLIGYTTKEDIHQNPFGIQPGVLIHGWTVSQILSNVLDKRPQIWYWSESIEWLWISAWGLTGGLIAWGFRPTWQAYLVEGVALGVVFGSSFFLFTQQGWIPLIPSSLNLAIAASLVRIILPRLQSKLVEPTTANVNSSSLSTESEFDSSTPQPTIIESVSPQSPASPQPTVVESAPPQPPSPQPTVAESATPQSPSPQPTVVESVSPQPPSPQPTVAESSIPQSPASPQPTVAESATPQPPSPQPAVAESTTPQPPSRPTYTRQDPLAGKIIGNRYRLEKLLGKGGMSKVYLASDTRLANRAVAVKIMTNYSAANNQSLIKRFMRELQVISQLKSPNIVQVTDSGLTPEEKPFQGSPFYVMEYFEGRTLSELLQQSSSLSVNQAIRIMLQVCTGLSEAHKNGIIHRDLKPDNIFLVSGGAFGEEAKILDFGIAKIIETEERQHTQVTQHGSFIGTYRYASPEQCKGVANIDRRTDIYSLGIILYEILSGKNPYNIDAHHTTQGEWIACHIRAEPQPLSSHQHIQDLPDKLEQIVMKCLCKSREERFENLEELTQALKEVNPELF